MVILLALALLLATAEAGWGFGYCAWGQKTTPTQNFDFSPEKFAGMWYEVQRDKGHDIWKNQKCIRSTYKQSTSKIPLIGDVTFDLTREFVQKFLWWGWDSTTSDEPIVKNNKGIYIRYFDLIFSQPHQVVATDYDNWAVVYGCQDYLVPLYFNYATLLSRHTQLPGNFVAAARRQALSTANYHFKDEASGWVNTCDDWTLGETVDEQVISMFSSEPAWGDYGPDSNGTKQVREFFQQNSDHVPYGFISTELKVQQPADRAMGTPMNDLVFVRELESYFVLKGIKKDSYDYDTFIDVWIGTHGLNDTQIGQLQLITKALESGVVSDICCFEFQAGAQFYVKPLINGFGRIIMFDKKKNEIVQFREGEFSEGTQVNFGRFSIQDFEKDASFEQVTFTGWIPNQNQSGKGFVTLNQYIKTTSGGEEKDLMHTEWHQGSWDPLKNWGNSIEDYRNISGVFVVQDLATANP